VDVSEFLELVAALAELEPEDPALAGVVDREERAAARRGLVLARSARRKADSTR
jgi:hypothetical protein